MSELYRPNDPNTIQIRESMADNIRSLGFDCPKPQEYKGRESLYRITTDLPFNLSSPGVAGALESYSGNGQPQNDFGFKFSVLKEYTNECLTEIARKMGQEKQVDPITNPYFNDKLGIYDNCRAFVDGLATLGNEKPEVVTKLMLDYYFTPADQAAERKTNLDAFLEANYKFKDIDSLKRLAPNATVLDLTMMEYVLDHNGPILKQVANEQGTSKPSKFSSRKSPYGFWYAGSGTVQVFPENLTGMKTRNAMRDGLLTGLSAGLGWAAMSPTMGVLLPAGVGTTLLALRARKYAEKKPELNAFRKEILGHEIVHEMAFSNISSQAEKGKIKAKTGLKIYYRK